MLSDDVDLRYRPLADLDAWTGAAVDDRTWTAALRRFDDLKRAAPAWCDMVGRGARLAAAHQSAALDGMLGGDRETALSLLAGTAAAAELGADARVHVSANDEALLLAASVTTVSETVMRRVHEVACRPQVTHRVETEGGLQDHVLAHGEYKHHSNHVAVPDEGWRPHAPVARVDAEMGRLAALAGSGAFAAVHPAVQGAYVLHGLSHVAPFADGNGRVARAVAGGLLLRAGGLPLLLFADDAPTYDDALDAADLGHPHALVGLVLRRTVVLVELLVDLLSRPADGQDAALDRWCAEVGAAETLGALVADALPRALARHRARADLGWLSPLTDAQVVVPAGNPHGGRSELGALVIRVPLAGGRTVEEVLAIDAHRLDCPGRVVLRAQEAGLRLDERVAEPGPGRLERLEPWLDRVVATLALRTAAELA